MWYSFTVHFTPANVILPVDLIQYRQIHDDIQQVKSYHVSSAVKYQQNNNKLNNKLNIFVTPDKIDVD